MIHQIEWVQTPESESGYGHGVEFHHDGLPGRVAAFIDGFGWLHQPGQQPVRVEIVDALSKMSETEAEVREAVEAFLERGGVAEHRHGRVRAWLNG